VTEADSAAEKPDL